MRISPSIGSTWLFVLGVVEPVQQQPCRVTPRAKIPSSATGQRSSINRQLSRLSLSVQIMCGSKRFEREMTFHSVGDVCASLHSRSKNVLLHQDERWPYNLIPHQLNALESNRHKWYVTCVSPFVMGVPSLREREEQLNCIPNSRTRQETPKRAPE